MTQDIILITKSETDANIVKLVPCFMLRFLHYDYTDNTTLAFNGHSLRYSRSKEESKKLCIQDNVIMLSTV